MRPLRAAVVGGTGPFGRALAKRLAVGGVGVRVGSRSPERAAAVAAALRQEAALGRRDLEGCSNQEAAASSEVVFLTVPFRGREALLAGLASELEGKLVIDCGVIWPPGSRPETSAAEDAARALREAGAAGVRVAAAFQTVAAGVLAGDPANDPEDGDAPDVLVFADRDEDREEAVRWCGQTGLRALPAGPLQGARAAEAALGVLLELNRGPARHAGVRITGVRS